MTARMLDPISLAAFATALLFAMPGREPTQASGRTELETALQMPLQVTNRSARRLACVAELAHWHALTFARLVPGESATIDLRFDVATGTYFILNDALLPIPVESVWCGIEGRAYLTRSLLPLDGNPAARPARKVVSCRADSERVQCRPDVGMRRDNTPHP